MLDLYCREVATLMDDGTDMALDDCEFQWELHLSDGDLVDAIAQQRNVPRTDVLAGLVARRRRRAPHRAHRAAHARPAAGRERPRRAVWRGRLILSGR
jgi:hypothetical protein